MRLSPTKDVSISLRVFISKTSSWTRGTQVFLNFVKRYINSDFLREFMDQKTATISNERLEKYFSITKEALAKAKSAPCGTPCCSKRTEHAHTVLDMAQRYYDDALHFQKKGEIVNAFACLNYAHGWLEDRKSTRLNSSHMSI